jgi:hypothetical protein
VEEVREYHLPDFSNWKKQGAFEKMFGRLGKNFQASIGKRRRKLW